MKPGRGRVPLSWHCPTIYSFSISSTITIRVPLIPFCSVWNNAEAAEISSVSIWLHCTFVSEEFSVSIQATEHQSRRAVHRFHWLSHFHFHNIDCLTLLNTPLAGRFFPSTDWAFSLWHKFQLRVRNSPPLESFSHSSRSEKTPAAFATRKGLISTRPQLWLLPNATFDDSRYRSSGARSFDRKTKWRFSNN